MRVVLALVVVLLALPAHAGPWPREKGEAFVSLSATNGTLGLWVEYGLGRGNWLIMDAMQGRDGHLRGQLGWHRALGKQDSRHRLSFGFAVGAEQSALGEVIPYLASNVSWGMGLQRPFNGWISLDLNNQAGISLQTLQLHQMTKGDLTVGANLADRWKGIVQLQSRYSDDTFAVHLAPSVVWEWRSGLHLELGLRQGLIGADGQEWKLGSWFRF